MQDGVKEATNTKELKGSCISNLKISLKTGKKTKTSALENNAMTRFNKHLVITTLNVSDLNSVIKRHRLLDLIKKTKCNHILPMGYTQLSKRSL